MPQPYCGKSCESCAHKTELACPGCHEGPGRKAFGDCAIAACCRMKSHESCGSCSDAESCLKYRMRMDVSLNRKCQKTLKMEQSAELNRSAPILGKYIWCLFWLLIVNAVGTVLLELSLYLPSLTVMAVMLRDISTILSGVCLLRISKHSDHLKTGGWCTLLFGLSVMVGTLIERFFMLPGMILACIGFYHEVHGYAQLTCDIAPTLSDSWRMLWTGCAVLIGILGLIIILLFVFPTAASTITLVLYVGRVAAFFVKQSLLKNTAQVFRNHRPVAV